MRSLPANIPLAQESNLTRDTIWRLAESFAKQLQFKVCDDLKTTIKKLGGKIRVEDTLSSDPERSGSLFVEGIDNFTIVLPYHTGSNRDRFTIAHELGHYVVHYLWAKQSGQLSGDQMIALRRGSERVEWEANWFAGAFLMPENQFRKKFKELGGNTSRLASQFCVSPSAVEVRIKSLGL